MFQRLFSLVAVMALSSCVSVAPARYDSQSSSALLVAAVRSDPGAFRHVLRRIDRTTNSFVGDPVYVSTQSTVPVMSVHRQLNLNDGHRSVILDATELPPGDYVRVEVWQSYSLTVMTASWLEWCLSTGPVYTLRPGAISILRLDDIGDPPRVPVAEEIVLSDFARARQERPDLVGEPVVVRPSSMLRWQTREAGSLASRNCAESRTFEVVEPSS